MKQDVTLAEAIDLILSSKGKIMTVEFTKRSDGSTRVMNCRTGVKRHLTGEGSRYSFKEKGLIPVFDLVKKQYRVINTPGIKTVRLNGGEYNVK